MSSEKMNQGLCVLKALGFGNTPQFKRLKCWVDDNGIFEGKARSDDIFGEYKHYIFDFEHEESDYIIISNFLDPNASNGYFYSTMYHEATHGISYWSTQGLGSINDYLIGNTTEAEKQVDNAIAKAQNQIIEKKTCCKNGRSFEVRISLFDQIICRCGGTCLSCDNPHRS